MKNESEEERLVSVCNRAIKSYLYGGNIDKEYAIKALSLLQEENDINPELLYETLQSGKKDFIENISLAILSSKNDSFKNIFSDKLNPVEYAIRHFIKFKDLSLSSLSTEKKEAITFSSEDLENTLMLFSCCKALVNSDSISLAIMNCERNIVDILLNFESMDLENSKKEISPLECAINLNDTELFQTLIEKGADIKNSSPTMDYPIFSIVNQNRTDMLEILIKKNMLDVNITSKIDPNLTPLISTIINTSYGTIKKLLAHGAVISFTKFIKDQYINYIAVKEYLNKNNFFLEYNREIKKFTPENIYEDFKEFKNQNDHFMISVLLTNYAKDLYAAIKKYGSQKENIEYFQKNSIKFSFKFNDLKIASMTDARNELIDPKNKLSPLNLPDLKEQSRTYIDNYQLFWNKNSDLVNLPGTEHYSNIYVIDKNGILYLSERSNTQTNSGLAHSYFLKGNPEDDLYGFGKPIACGGQIKIKNGKITYIDNGSGHYKPTADQLKLAIKYLDKQGILDKNVKIYEYPEYNQLNLETILSENVKIDVPELFDTPNDQYNLIEYYDVLGENPDF